jgi:hypothetical protein
MNTANAVAFFILGIVMQVLPQVTSMGGSGLGAQETQTLWLQFMGFVTGGMGAGYLIRMGAREAAVLVARTALRRAEAREQIAQGARAPQEMPLGVRVTF